MTIQRACQIKYSCHHRLDPCEDTAKSLVLQITGIGERPLGALHRRAARSRRRMVTSEHAIQTGARHAKRSEVLMRTWLPANVMGSAPMLSEVATGWLQRFQDANVRLPEAWDRHVCKT
jgi:hypothetical protein